MAIVFPGLAKLIERQRGIVDGDRNARFWFKEQMLDALRFVGILDDVRGATETFFDVTSLELRFAEQVGAALWMNERSTRFERCLWARDWLEYFVFDIDQLRRFARQSLRVGDDAGDDVAAAASLLTDCDVNRPIL